MIPKHHLAKEDIPGLPLDVRGEDLDTKTRAALGALDDDYADRVARHLVMCARMLDSDPELAYRHARTAADRAGRIAVVRETAGIAAYVTGRYAEAIRELRTYQRLSGTREHLPIIADCQRGIGRPEKAIEIAASAEGKALTGADRTEMLIVMAGSRADLGEFDAALAVLTRAGRTAGDEEEVQRVALALERVEALAAGVEPAEADLLSEPAIAVDAEAGEYADDDTSLFDAEEGVW
jgi:tetratricopeptide (TPR) repeat protein